MTVSPFGPSLPPLPCVYPHASSVSAPERLPSRTKLIRPLPEPAPNSQPFNSLPPLELSCLSFSTAHQLFSTTCSLFSQNTRGWGTPSALCLRVSAAIQFLRAALPYLPLESTLVKVYQNKQLYLPLESTLVKKPGGGGPSYLVTRHCPLTSVSVDVYTRSPFGVNLLLELP